MNRSATRNNNETITNEDTRRKMADHTEFGPRKTIIVLAIVAGCFAILWPKIFYPMLSTPVNTIHTPIDGPACCDLIFESDVNAVDIMQEMCKNILRHHQVDPRIRDALKSNKLTPQSASFCRDEVLARCGIDLSSFLAEKERLGKTYKQVLEEIRTFNSSLCLKNQFGVPLSQLGTPHLIRYHILMPHSPMRQERRVPPHAGGLHPALQQRGRAIPSSHIVPKVDGRPDHVVIEKMRPPLGAAGRVVPPPSGGNSMGIIMPLYTLGIFLFFLYTIAKVMRKNSDNEIYADYQNPTAEREFRDKVFDPEVLTSAMTGVPCYRKERSPSPTRLVPTIEELKEQAAGDIEIDQLRQRLVDTEAAMERIVVQMGSLSRTVVNGQNSHQDPQLQDECVLRSCCRRGQNEVEELDESSPTVKVMGMEMTACCEGGQRISRPTTPIITHTHPEREMTPPKPIYLEGALPPQCELLVTDSETQAENSEDDTEAPVVLSGKMTLSLISHDQNQADTEDESLEEKESPSPAVNTREKRDLENDTKALGPESKEVQEGSESEEGSEDDEEEEEDEVEGSEVEEDDEEDENDENYEEDDEADENEASDEDVEEEIQVSRVEKISGTTENQVKNKVSMIVKKSTDDEDEDEEEEEEEDDEEEEEEEAEKEDDEEDSHEIVDSEHNENEDSEDDDEDEEEEEEEEEEESEAVSSEEEEVANRRS